MIRLRSAVSALALSVTLAGLASVPARAQLFGPSDEEVAREAGQDRGIADLGSRADQLNERVSALESKVRSLTESLAGATGANEELSHRIQLQNQKIDAMQKDFAYRICTLSAQQMGVSSDGSDGGINCAAAGSGGGSGGGFAVPTPQTQAQPGTPLPPIGGDGGGNGASQQFAPSGSMGQTAYDDTPGRGRPPGVLRLPPPQQSGAAYGGPPTSGGPTRLSSLQPAPGGGAVAPGNGGQYDRAMNLLSKAQYSEAAAAFQAYADANPDDTNLTPQAIYWIGNINYVQHNYEPAQRSFAEVLKKYPKSDRAPDAMLKLAQSFLAAGQKTEGCTTLGLVKSKYPKAPDSTLSAAASLRRSSGCR